MTTQEIHQKLAAQFGEIVGPQAEGVDPSCVVRTDAVAEVCAWLRDEPGIELASLMCLSSTDDKEKLGVTYNLHSMAHKHRITLKVELSDREHPHVPTVSHLFGTADWHEREAYDMMGIVFDGHPDLRRILCPDDWEGWPLRKDYKVQEFYRGLRVPYPEGQDPDRGHWISRTIRDLRVDPPEIREPELDGM
ncbi:MAG TPA: NADH-quinone oxidoreductase subunit C [candidate division Zixibacteria bacterium]|jgi:NADH-quinone oxidoreductase subunit C